jgi:DNA-binding LacI/PurR family transcriptional regulator
LKTPATHRSRLRATTIKSVAREAGVSTATVSRVLTGVNVVGDNVRAKVMKAVRKLDYHPNRLARSLREGRRKMIGVIIPDLQNPFLTGVVHGVEAVLYEAGYTLILGHSDGFPEREQAHIAGLRGEGAAGLILVPDNGEGANYASLQAWDIPVVAVDRIPTGFKVDLVSTNHREGSRQAVNHLVSHGHKDIALINGPRGFSVTQERLAGYQEALAQAKIASRAAYVVHSDFRLVGGETAMNQLLDLPKPPRAVLVGNNLMALGALQAIHKRGVKIPEEIAVVGFDDLPWASSLRPPLTVIAQPIEQLGQIAAQMLLDRLNDPHRPVKQVILPPQLIVRASCSQHPAFPTGRDKLPRA